MLGSMEGPDVLVLSDNAPVSGCDRTQHHEWLGARDSKAVLGTVPKPWQQPLLPLFLSPLTYCRSSSGGSIAEGRVRLLLFRCCVLLMLLLLMQHHEGSVCAAARGAAWQAHHVVPVLLLPPQRYRCWSLLHGLSLFAHSSSDVCRQVWGLVAYNRCQGQLTYLRQCLEAPDAACTHP